ncbi:L-aspartate oxidase [Planctomycetota bacterium]
MNICMSLNKQALLDINPNTLPAEECGVLVVGSGCAGMMTALHAAQDTDVLLATKKELEDSNTVKAQGGIAVPIGTHDDPRFHIEDTLKSGKGLCDPAVVEDFIQSAPEALEELVEIGARFDRDNGELLFAQEGGHSKPRIIRANGDATGAELTRALICKVKQHKRITLSPHSFLVDLLKAGQRIVGAVLFCKERKVLIRVLAKAVVLTTGGTGQVYRETTNPRTATGDGLAAALRAGAELQDMEFIQFHPTTLYIAGSSRLLISETLRGEGGRLFDRNGNRFMSDYSDKMELAPRDVVSRAVAQHLKKYGGTHVDLDMTHLDSEFVKNRFPWIYNACLNFKIDITKNKIPVYPAAHYTIGGIYADKDGNTKLEGLFACGEACSNRFHGANRLGSNSLLETLVGGIKTGIGSADYALKAEIWKGDADIRKDDVMKHAAPIDIRDSVVSLQSEMWRDVGIERNFEGLNTAWGRINFWSGYILGRTFNAPEGWELQNMLQVAKTIVKSAINRTESRGAHFREDYPETDDERWKVHTILSGE